MFERDIEMNKKAESKKKVVNILIGVAVIAGLLLTAHMLVNYFDIVEVLKKIHGG
jgi:hypothetical protein